MLAVDERGWLMGDEHERRQDASARQYLDTAISDSALQQSANLAAELFTFPIVVINVLDAGTRHTIASVGAPLNEVPRSSTLCDKTVSGGHPVVIGNLTEPPASAPQTRAYVAVPLTGREGLVIGTICLLDTRPRQFSAQQMVQLVAIGAVVQDQLEMLRRRGPQPAGSAADAAELTDAVNTGQVVPYYQPVVDLRTGQVTGVEALARWRHPARGMLAPAQFIPLAEDTEIIIDLDVVILHQAAVDFARWRRNYPSLRLNANLSAKHFDHPDCVERISSAVIDAGVSPDAVDLEITETTAMTANSGHRNFLLDLRSRGFRILLDDFATAFSVMEQVLGLPLDGIKLDQVATAALGTREGDAVIRAFLGLAADLNLETVIEGVETQRQAECALSIGCTHAQGYLWAPALPAAEIAPLLAARNRVDVPNTGRVGQLVGTTKPLS